MIKYVLTKLGRAGWENIWLSVMAHGPRCARSVRHDLEPNIFPIRPSRLVNKYIIRMFRLCFQLAFTLLLSCTFGTFPVIYAKVECFISLSLVYCLVKALNLEGSNK